ncbi:MAG: hypothetical protein Q4P15_00440 [Propionibacteriaceae bacterium]|nr:hypothetical protein [Propionibacteriaceae bacterium]
MTTAGNPPSAASPPRGWAPLWAKILAWVVLVPSVLAMARGVVYFIQGFGDETLAAVGFIVGPILFVLALTVVVPSVLFLTRRGKPAFIVAMSFAGFFLIFVSFTFVSFTLV